MLTLNAPIVTLISGTIIPLITGFMTSHHLSGKIKLGITVVLNLVTAILTSAIVTDTSYIISASTLYNAAVGFIISIAAYHGAYAKMNLTSSNIDGKLSPF